MATNTLSNRANLYDVIKFKAPSGGAVECAQVLNERNDLIKDMPAVPSNGGLFHQGLRTASLPSGSLVNVGETWGMSKTERTPFVEALATIRDSWECPTDVLRTEGAEVSQALVQDEDESHIEGNGQSWCNLIIQGSSAPVQNGVDGLMDRAPWNALDSEFCYNVGGTGSDLRSAWLIQPSVSTFHLIYNPNHPTMGVEFEDKGEVYVKDGSDATKHQWQIVHEYMLQEGICVRDQRAVKRLANVQCAVTDYVGPDVVKYAIIASLKHSTLANRPWFLYCDADLYSQLVLGANDKLKVYTSDRNIYQTELPMIGPNIIVRRLDALNHASGSGETAVT